MPPQTASPANRVPVTAHAVPYPLHALSGPAMGREILSSGALVGPVAAACDFVKVFTSFTIQSGTNGRQPFPPVTSCDTGEPKVRLDHGAGAGRGRPPGPGDQALRERPGR